MLTDYLKEYNYFVKEDGTSSCEYTKAQAETYISLT